ncbi:All-trans-phytoene synthase [Burkholderia multivorans]|nr:All-trans-phytoene synthase [Burkholderia multivorans]
MNFDDYCQQKAAPAGSSVYYALRQAPAAVEPRLTALFALRRELEETVKEISDPTVGHTKLAWWHKELAALANGQPSHPVTQALARHHPSIAAEADALRTLVNGYGMDLEQARYLDFANLQRYVAQVGGTFAALVARAAAAQPGAPQPWAADVGRALMLAQFVQELGNDARHGRIYLPIDELQRYNVTAADLLNRRYSPAFTELMQFQTARAREALDAADAAIPAAERRAQRTLRAQIALARAARRNRARRLSGAASAHRADADPQAVDRLARRAPSLTRRDRHHAFSSGSVSKRCWSTLVASRPHHGPSTVA